MEIKSINAKAIVDTRGKETIQVFLKTDFGLFSASAPNGKSRGKFEKDVWKKDINGDIIALNKFPLYKINFNSTKDFENIEKIYNNKIGGNSMIALQYSFLKALAFKEKKEVWQIINPKAKIIPFPVGNIIGGGAHSNWQGPNFQEFHIIPQSNAKNNVEILKQGFQNAKTIISNINLQYQKNPKINDENAILANIDNNTAIQVIQDVKENLIDEFSCKIHMGIDVASTEFFKNKKYIYGKNKLSSKEQIELMTKLSDIFYYLEDPLQENDFKGFSQIRKKSKGLIVGDDLTTTNPIRLKKAIKEKSISGIIVKPNQIGSMVKVSEIVDLCRKNNIKMIFSHRSGETSEDILADLAVGYKSDYIKTGALGKGRDEKLNRLIKIQESI